MTTTNQLFADKTILLVDDDEILRTRMGKAFTYRNMHVLEATCFEEAIELLGSRRVDFAVLDLKMPGKTGLQLLETLKQISPDTSAVVLTGYGSIANAVEAVKLGADNYVTKPADIEQILAAFQPSAEEREKNEIDYQSPSLASAEWEHIQRVLADCGGNISEAARCLDVPRRTLQRKLKKLAP